MTPIPIKLMALSFILGLVVAFSIPFANEQFAQWYSREIFDCAIRFAPDLRGGKVDGFHATKSHHYGVCYD